MTTLPDARTFRHAKIGEIIVAWNSVEYLARNMLSHIAGGGPSALALTANLGNVAVKEGLDVLANEILTGSFQDHVFHFGKMFDCLREHRNWTVHGVIAIAKNSSGETIGISQMESARSRLVLHQKHTTIDELEELLSHIKALNLYGGNILFSEDLTGIPQISAPRLSLLEKPPLPDRLQKPRLFLRDVKHPPESSPG